MRNAAHYFSKRLRHKMEQMGFASASVVEAPSGYGKTTAVRECLEPMLPQGAETHWFAAVDEDTGAAFERLSKVIGQIDAHAGDRLLELGIPNAFTLGQVCDVVRAIECEREAWLIIDDFQRLSSWLPHDFVIALFEHGGSALHVVIMTQILSRDLRAAVESNGILYVGSSDLRFQAHDIQEYFLFSGFGLTQQEAQRVFRCTDGWAIGVYLQLCEYRETGGFSESAILPLMERLIWDRLSGEQQKLYLMMSPFDTISMRQLCALLSCAELPEYAQSALSNPFVRYDPAARRYGFHAILSELVTEKRLECGAAFDRACLLVAGDLCRDEGRTAEAFAFYRQAGDFDKMLSLDLSALLFSEIKNEPFFVSALDIAQKCPEDIKRRHPLSVLRIAWAVKASGEDAVFCALMDELDGYIGQTGTLRAEWLLLTAYQMYPDLSGSLSCVQRASLLFDGATSQVILPAAPWCFGGYFQLSEFHVTAGELDREADALEAFIQAYAPLTNGHGRGADSLMRAEIAYYRGDLPQAETYAHKAAFLAEGNGQTVLQIGAVRVLADIALFNADEARWQQAISAMERAAMASDRSSPTMRILLDTARGSLLNDLQEQESIADWLKNGDFLSRRLPLSVKNNALFVHVMYLLQRGELLRFVGTQEAIPSEIICKTAWSAHLFALLMALGHYFLGNRDKAAAYLEQAAEQALPDGIILTFASASWRLGGLVEDLIAAEYPSLYDGFCSAKNQFGAGWTAVRDMLEDASSTDGLTAREHEIALLAAEGLRNSEIASRLCLSESTVRAHMRTVFQKLNIDRRAKLAAKLK